MKKEYVLWQREEISMRIRMEAWDKTRGAAACGGDRAGTNGGGPREAGCLGREEVLRCTRYMRCTLYR